MIDASKVERFNCLGEVGPDKHLVSAADYDAMVAERNGLLREWVSVEERLPEEGQLCIMLGDGVVQHALYSLDEGYWVPHDEDFDRAPFHAFTHWMPLPAPPKTKEPSK